MEVYTRINSPRQPIYGDVSLVGRVGFNNNNYYCEIGVSIAYRRKIIFILTIDGRGLVDIARFC